MLVLKLWNSLACQCSCLSLEGDGGRHYHWNVRETHLHLSIFCNWLWLIKVCVCVGFLLFSPGPALLSHCWHLCCICDFCSTSRVSLYEWFLPRTLTFRHLFNLIHSVHLLGLSLNAMSPSKLSLTQILTAPSCHVPLQSSSPLPHPVSSTVIIGGILALQ